MFSYTPRQVACSLIGLLAAIAADAGPQTADLNALTQTSVPDVQGVPPDLPPQISSVASGGYWEDGERNGIIRVIVVNVGNEAVHSLVYLEWLQETPGEDLRRVTQTPVSAINEGASWSVGTPVLHPSENGQVLELPATEVGSYKERRFELGVPVRGVGRFEMR